MATDFLILPDRRIAYQRIRGDAQRPGVLFLSGYASDMAGTKAGYVAERCAEANLSFVRFDYRGHGESSGDFRDGTIGAWFDDVCKVFEALTEGPQIIIGSSMGGWMALMLAMKYPSRVRALVGVAAAPDFTEDLIWRRLLPERRAQMELDGFIYDESAPPDERPPITLNLIEEARQHLLTRETIPVTCPVRLIQGLADHDVPWRIALRVLERIGHDDVRVTLIKNGNHRLSRSQDMDLLWRTVLEFA